MPLHSIGDLALGYQTRLGNQRLRSEIASLTEELTTGQRRDPAASTRGDMSALAAIDRSLSLLRAHDVATGEAALFTASIQTALAGIQDTGSALGPAMLEAGTNGHSTMVGATASDAHARMETVIATLNTRVAGRALFAGADTQGTALADRDTMLADLTTAIVGETTAAGVIAAVETWFDTPGGGFETVGYRGADSPLAGFRLGEGEAAQVTLTGADHGLRDLLKGYALGALVAEGALSVDHDARSDILRDAAERIMAGDAAIAGLGADVGRAEARIEAARTANTAETTALEIARAGLVSADPFDTATALQEAEGQLQALYAITARLARLSLTEFL